MNFGATDCIASVCHAFGIHPLVFVSTDQVFDGVAGNYAESAPTNPLNVYGETKARAEEVVLKNGGRVARVALTLGHSKDGNRSPNEHVVNLLRARQPCMLYTNEFRTPIHVDDVASALVELLSLEPPVPILHLGGPDRVNRMELGLGIARAYKLDQSLCTPTTSSTATASANSGGVRRAADTSLDTTLARATLKVPPMPISECVDTLRRTQPSHAL